MRNYRLSNRYWPWETGKYRLSVSVEKNTYRASRINITKPHDSNIRERPVFRTLQFSWHWPDSINDCQLSSDFKYCYILDGVSKIHLFLTELHSLQTNNKSPEKTNTETSHVKAKLFLFLRENSVFMWDPITSITELTEKVTSRSF